jgi:outer membrane protein TolC
MRLAGIVVLLIASCTGCTRAFWRANADRETYPVVAERAWEAGFATDRLSLDPPPQSRLADPTDPDKPPKPPDDPVAAAHMARPNGMHGAIGWRKHGEIDWIEPPGWESGLPLGPDGRLTLDAERAFELALLHSREYQTQLEQLYLSALALTLNRFEFQTRWFLRNATGYTSAAGGTPNETSTFDTTTNFGFERSFAAGGQLVVDFANSFVLEYLGNGRTGVSSTFVVNFVQPLLRNAGRKVRLEQLTQAERDVLYAARDFYRFRKQFWAGVTTLDGGYLSLLLQVQTIRNAESNRVGQEQNLRLHEELFRGGKKSIVEVDQAFQGFLQAQLNVSTTEANLQTALDQFKFRLGLPPRIPARLDDAALRPFVLVDPKLEALRAEVESYQKARNRDIDAAPPLNELQQQYVEFEALAARLEPFVAAVAAELADWGQNLPTTDDDPARRARATYEQFRETYPETAGDLGKIRDAARLDTVDLGEWARQSRRDGMVAQAGGLGAAAADTVRRKAGWEALVVHTRRLLTLTDNITGVQTQIRINRITLPSITWTETEGLAYAKANRLDLQTAQAAVTDAWRKMWVAANALRSDLDVVADAQVGTGVDPRNAFDFAADANRFRVGVQFDGPLNRKAERNAYRASQIAYQQARRAYMELSDQVEQAVRADLRNLVLTRVNFEIARLRLVSAARQLEGARQQLLKPQQGAADASTLNVLNALNALLDAQNALAAGYISFEQLRVQLLLDLEALTLDPRGHPIDERRSEFAGDRPASAAGPAARLLPPPK